MYHPRDGTSVYDIQIDAEMSEGDDEPGRSVIFPDKDLLFQADFRRSGTDLLLVGRDGKTAIVYDYFKDDRRSSLITPEGADLSAAAIKALSGPENPGEYAQAAVADESLKSIGRVEKISGSATVLRNGVPVELHLGDPVAKGDVVQTASDSSVTIKFTDGMVFGLSSSARIVLNDMVYQADASGGSALFTLVQGVIGFVAGKIAKTGDLKVETPVATMAIRGTAVQTEISAASGTTKFSLLTEPDGRVGSFVLLDKHDPTKVLTTISSATVATLLTPVALTDIRISQISKSPNDIQGENDFVRDLFQVFSPEQRQRRGSSDFEGIPTVPVNTHLPSDDLRQTDFAITPILLQLLEPRGSDVRTPSSVRVEGAATEDGPFARLDAVSDDFTRTPGVGPPTVNFPSSLPPGVTFVRSARSFALDPSDPAYQRLAQGETLTVTVNYSLTYAGVQTPASISWTITGENDAPVARDVNLGTNENATATAAFGADDVDSDASRATLAYSIVTAPEKGTVSLAPNGTFRFQPGLDFDYLAAGESAVVSFTYKAGDGSLDSTVRTITVTVQGTNDEVVAQDIAVSVDEDSSLAVAASFSDKDLSDNHAFSVDTSQIKGAVEVNPNGTFTYRTNGQFEDVALGETGIDSFTYTVDDGKGGASTETVTVTITGLNDGPVANDDNFVGIAETGRSVLAVGANDSDIDGDALQIVQWSAPVEGSVEVGPSGTLIFDPGDDFEALSEGQTATVSFNYTVSDGHGGTETATATAQVQGSGTFTAPHAQDIANGVLAFNDQPVSLTLDAPSQTTTATANIAMTIGLGPVIQPQMNILYVMDISGSTRNEFAGTPVGDLNQDGADESILDAEIASLIGLTERVRALGLSPADVTVTIIPFNENANPADPVEAGQTDANTAAVTFSLGANGDQTITNFLSTLRAGGGTSFEDALQASIERLQVLDQGGEQNLIYFLSDGNGTGSLADELETLTSVHQARITAIGIGEDANLALLHTIDNTGGAERVTSSDQLDASLVPPPIQSGDVVDVDVFVNGIELPGIGREDLISVPNGYALNLDVGGLSRQIGSSNTVSASIVFASGEILTTELPIAGVFPLSTDLVL
ncbi:Ig-like domain-containing protein [Microvirga aerophila]|uniref:VWFA domain-containing protein n=1 Tax=Microvirga aerophila TaxID=670291 RepID=A0A512C039_9HYPH|nr:Ig-like domain-containing protein [Microvirga aerophila]GEO17550.1 hypothetical protein MAE02_52460 [Microvirga aerophila]